MIRTPLPTKQTPMIGRMTLSPPQIGDRYACTICGMEIEVIANCGCPDARKVQFDCCGQKMKRNS